MTNINTLIATVLTSPLGDLLATSSETELFSLQFVDMVDVDEASLTMGMTAPLESITAELRAYFQGKLKSFSTPVRLVGTPFRQQAWQALRKVPFGETRSYTDQAQAIGHPAAVRAVANANGANPLVIVLPCHRIIAKSGKLGGYSCGLSRKVWLLQHEEKFAGL